MFLHTMESLTNNLTGIGNQDKRARLHFFDIVSKKQRLMAVQSSENNVFLIAGEGTLCVDGRRTAVQSLYNKLTNWLRITADDVEILGHVHALDNVVHQEGLDQQTKERVHTSFNAEHKKTGNCHEKVSK